MVRSTFPFQMYGAGFGAGFFGETRGETGSRGESAPLDVIRTPAPKWLASSGFAVFSEEKWSGRRDSDPGRLAPKAELAAC